MTKAELVASLSQAPFNYIGIGTPENPNNEGEVNGITKYIINVFEIGKSQPNQQPTGYRKNITFYVYNEGDVGEAAYFELVEPSNASDTDVAATSAPNAGASYSIIYTSTELKKRTLGFMIKATTAIFNEDPGTADHATRLKLANYMCQSEEAYLPAFMVQIANNATVRSEGNSISDGDLEWIINSEILTVAKAYGYNV